MANQIINIGAAPNDGTGDPVRTAFTKANSNFAELYGRVPTDTEVISALAAGDDGFGFLTTTNPDSVDPEKGRSPIFGGRAHYRMPRRKIGTRTIAHFGTVADLAVSATGFTDVVDTGTELTRAFTGPSILQYSETGNGNVRTIAGVALTNPIDMSTGGNIVLNYKPVQNLNQLDRFNIELHSAGAPGAPTANFHQLVITGAPFDLRKWSTGVTSLGRQQKYSLAVGQFTAAGTGANLAAITFARVSFRFVSGQTGTIQLGDLEYVPPATKAKAILSFDDAFATQFTVMAKEMAKRGFVGVLYPGAPAARIGGGGQNMTRTQMQTLHDQGWQVGAQAWDTELASIVDTLSVDQQVAMYAEERAWRKQMGIADEGDGSFYTQVSHFDMAAWEALRRMHRSMRGFFDGNDANPPFVYGETMPPGDPMLIRALNMATPTWGANTSARLIAHVDQAIANKGLAMFAVHFEPQSAGNVQTGFLALLDYLDAQRANIDVVTTRELWD